MDRGERAKIQPVGDQPGGCALLSQERAGTARAASASLLSMADGRCPGSGERRRADPDGGTANRRWFYTEQRFVWRRSASARTWFAPLSVREEGGNPRVR